MVLTLADLTDVDTKRAGPTAVDVGELCYSCAGGGLGGGSRTPHRRPLWWFQRELGRCCARW